MVRVWHSADGLPSDSVTALLQTRDGFLWIGTSAGLARFDGLTFTRVELTPGATHRPVYVTALCEDSEGNLYIGTQGEGLFRQERGGFRRFSKQQGLPDSSITSLAAATGGGVWAGCPVGLSLVTDFVIKSYTTRDGLPYGSISGVSTARSGAVWITTRSGICRLLGGRLTRYAFEIEGQGRNPEHLGVCEDRQGNLWGYGDTYLVNLTDNPTGGSPLNYFRTAEVASTRIWSVCAGRSGGLWVGTSGRGLFRLENKRLQRTPFGGKYDVRALYEDREGSLWLGTYGDGLAQLRSPSVRIVEAGRKLLPSPPTALALDLNGRVCVGLQRGGLFVGQFGRFERLGGQIGWQPLGFISCLCVTRDGTLWAGTLGDGIYGLSGERSVHFTTGNGLAEDTILFMCADPTDTVWAGTGAGTLHRLNEQGVSVMEAPLGLLGGRPTVMVPVPGGPRWLGTQDGRIVREENGNFTEVFRDAGRHPVLALYPEKPGRLWCGTAGGGLTCLSGRSAQTWDTTNGLPNDIVVGVIEDDDRNLWLVTAAGICRVKRTELEKALAFPKLPLNCELMAKTKNQPNSDLVVGGSRALRAPNGQLWFASFDGLLQVDTHPGVPEIESSVLPVLLESVVFNGQLTVALPGSEARPGIFRAPSSLRSVEFRFTTMSFISPELLELRHQLEGFDLDWLEDAGVRVARYGRLPYGRYRFRAAARYPGGAWGEAPHPFVFEVPTPLYKQTWALILYGLSLAALVGVAVRLVSHRRLRASLALSQQREALERERLRIARDMHDDIGSKLTKLSFQSERAQVDAESLAEPLSARIHSIAETSQELLKTLDGIVWSVNPQNDTLDNLVAYLSQYADEYFQDSSIQCHLRLPAELPNCPVTSEVRHNILLTFKEALNNVLRHSAATTITVKVMHEALLFEIQITDNGKGFDVLALPAEATPVRSGRGGNGLTNMRQRMEAIGGQCRVCSRPGQGTTVSLLIRLPRHSANSP
jgi:signal transduction histidine kinase/ligand-binding sensor domain-containing protein